MSDLQIPPGDRGANARLYTVLGVLFGLLFPVIATAVYLASQGLPLTVQNIVRAQTQPLMWIIDTAPLFLGGLAAFAGRRQDAVESASRLAARQARELQLGQQELEARVAERTREIQQRESVTRQTVQVTRRLSEIQDLPEIAAAAVQSLAATTPGYIVDLYLIDERRQEAVRAASSESPQAPAISVPIGDARLVGQVAASGEVGRMPTEDMGQEFALPLTARGRTLGLLHLRPTAATSTLPADLDVLQLLADQLGSIMETARLFGQAQDAMRQLQLLSGASSQTAWAERAAEDAQAFEFTPAGTRPTTPGAASTELRGLKIPVELRGQKIGTIALRRPGAEPWTEADRDLAEKTAAQVALALENVRLLDETRERALQERRLSEFSAKLAQSVDLDSLLQAAVRELASMPDVAEASIILNPAPNETAAGNA